MFFWCPAGGRALLPSPFAPPLSDLGCRMKQYSMYEADGGQGGNFQDTSSVCCRCSHWARAIVYSGGFCRKHLIPAAGLHLRLARRSLLSSRPPQGHLCLHAHVGAASFPYLSPASRLFSLHSLLPDIHLSFCFHPEFSRFPIFLALTAASCILSISWNHSYMIIFPLRLLEVLRVALGNLFSHGHRAWVFLVGLTRETRLVKSGSFLSLIMDSRISRNAILKDRHFFGITLWSFTLALLVRSDCGDSHPLIDHALCSWHGSHRILRTSRAK